MAQITQVKTITELAADLEQAKAALLAAAGRESIASQDATDCRNRLNNIQKAIDAWYENQKKNAPYYTEWKK